MRDYMLARSMRGFGALPTMELGITPLRLTPTTEPPTRRWVSQSPHLQVVTQRGMRGTTITASAPKTTSVVSSIAKTVADPITAAMAVGRATVSAITGSDYADGAMPDPWRAQVIAAAAEYHAAISHALELMPTWTAGANALRVAALLHSAAMTESEAQLRMRLAFFRPVARTDMPASRSGAAASDAADDVLLTQDALRAAITTSAAVPAATTTPRVANVSDPMAAAATRDPVAVAANAEATLVRDATVDRDTSGGESGGVIYASDADDTRNSAHGAWFARYRWWLLGFGAAAVIGGVIVTRKKR